MRSALLALLLLASAASNADSVIIDFEEFTAGPVDPLTSSGFLFSSEYSASAGITYFSDFSGNAFGCNGGCRLVIENSGGNLFDLLSVDVIGGGAADIHSDLVTMTGFFSGGGQSTIQVKLGYDWNMHTFTPGWTSLERVELDAHFCNPGCLGGFGIDNVTVSVVPVPAALWLFSSGLVCLGWLRRKVIA